MTALGNKQIISANIKRYMAQAGVNATDVCGTLGIPMPTFSDWINAKTYPRIDKVEMLANYFGATKADLVEEYTGAPLTPKDERDIARDAARIMDDLANSGELMFDGVPMSSEARASMAAAIRIGLEQAKILNKETYTPKKYRKE